ncbi:MAG: type II secretion system GspH family protein [Candidatus Gastranaerophilales bacterium]|nr:type II secretion system GspH family protein [Candidatus Gastranaerophilales bacterium]
MKKKNIKLLGFTLAEVLITLGIIGVVAAITIPGLMTTYKAHQLHSQFLKSYSTLQQVFKQMEADDVSTNPADYKSTKDTLFYKTFIKYLSAPTDCGNYYEAKNIKGCYDYMSRTNGYKSLDGKSYAPNAWFDAGEIMLQDGTIIMFENNSTSQLYIHVDLNGYSKKPNVWGYDLFTFHFKDGELKPMGAADTTYTNVKTYCNQKNSNSLNGIACANLAKDNTDYFKNVIKNIKQ